MRMAACLNSSTQPAIREESDHEQGQACVKNSPEPDDADVDQRQRKRRNKETRRKSRFALPQLPPSAPVAI